MPKYTALTPVKHDGKRYAAGASIDLTKAEAEALPDGTVEVPRAEDLAARKAAEKAEAARKQRAEAEAADIAEAERKAREDAEAAEKAEAERLAAEQAEADRLAAEKAAAGDGSKQG